MFVTIAYNVLLEIWWCHFHKAQKKKHKVPKTVGKDLISFCIYLSDFVFHESLLWHC